VGIQDISQIGWHSCRKTKACLTFQETKEEDSVRTILGHTKKSVVFRKYIGPMKHTDKTATAQRVTNLSKVLLSKRKNHIYQTVTSFIWDGDNRSAGMDGVVESHETRGSL